MHGDAGVPALELEGGALVGILEAAPAADVVGQDRVEIGVVLLSVLDELLQPFAVLHEQAALRVVGIGANDFHVVIVRVTLDDLVLIVGRVLLVLR